MMWKRLICRALCAGAVVGIALFGTVYGISESVCRKTEGLIFDANEAALIEGTPYDCVLVLGCRVYDDGRLSPMLHDRMYVATELMKLDVSDRLVVSGDHKTDDYNEVSAMKAYAVEQGIPSEAIFEDHDGYSTYDSIARLKTVYGAERVVIVTQEYHLPRAIYLAEAMGMDAVGVSADQRPYSKQRIYDFREMFARCKDVYLGVRKPTPAGDLTPIPLDSDGDLTACSRPVQ